MSYNINALTAPDAYTTASTLQNVPISSIMLDVANQAIYWQLQIRSPGQSNSAGIWEDTETYNTPGSRNISSDRDNEITGIRFRAAVKAANLPAGATQAVVTIRTSP